MHTHIWGTNMKNKNILINIAIIFGFMLITSANIFIQKLSNLDEIWIYNFGRCIINGLLPYKDFSIIITPLFAYISAAFLRVFGSEMIVLRCAEVIQTALVLFMIYKNLEKLKVNKGISLLFTLGIYYLYSKSFCFDYNWAVLLISLIILYRELREDKTLEYKFKSDLIIGVLAGITILLKQTSGIILSLVVIGYKAFEIRNKNEFKTFIEILLARILGVLLPILAFAIYLSYNNIWTDFIDYAISGISTFSNTIPYTRLLDNNYILAYVVPVFLALIFMIYIVTLTVKRIREKEWAIKIRVLFFFDIATAVVVYPISDIMHFSVATICTLLTVIYIINVWFVYGLKVENKKIKYAFNTFFSVLAILIFIIYVGISSYHTFIYIKNIQDEKYLRHFKYIQTSQDIYNTIEQVDEYIEKKGQEGKDVIVLDSMASAINIPIDKYYKNYDMFNLGNFGAKGEEGIIEDIKHRNNTIFMVKKGKYKNNWQHPTKIIDYVRQNFTIIDEIELFDIYSK